MTWYYVVAIVVAILVGATGITTALIKGVWILSTMFGELKISVVELRLTLASLISKQDDTQKDVTILTSKVENVQVTQQSLQVRTIRLEEKVDKLNH